MKVQDLFESGEAGKNVKAIRIMKFSIRDGKNELGIELDKIKCAFYDIGGGSVYIGKPKELQVGDKVIFENANKPNFSALSNQKIGSYPDEVKSIPKDLNAALSIIKKNRNPTIIINPFFAKGVTAPAKKEDTSEGLYFGISYWGDPYNRDNKEWFIVGPTTTSALAKKVVNSKLEKGQPRGFRDWVSGSVKVVDYSKLEDALTKLKLKTPQSIKDRDFDEGSVALWRPSKL